MSFSFIEQRHHDRRSRNLPVAFYANGDWDLKKHAVGQTLDVTTRGACIRTNRNHMPEINSPLILMLSPGIETAFSSSDTAIRIEGKVVWVNSDAKRFGISFS